MSIMSIREFFSQDKGGKGLKPPGICACYQFMIVVSSQKKSPGTRLFSSECYIRTQVNQK